MKKIKLPDPFKIRARMENKENKLMETMELLARVVDEKLYEAILPLDLERPYVGALDDIWTHTEEMDYEKAKEILYSMAVLLDEDARFILEHMVYPNKRGHGLLGVQARHHGKAAPPHRPGPGRHGGPDPEAEGPDGVYAEHHGL